MPTRSASVRPIGVPARFATSWVAAGLLVGALLLPRISDAPGLNAAAVRAAYYPDFIGTNGERLGARRPIQPAGLITELPLAAPSLILSPIAPAPTEQLAAGRAQAVMLTAENITEWRANTGLENSAMAARIEALETTIASLKDYLIVVAELQSRGDPERGTSRLVDGKVASDILEPPPPDAADRRPLVHLASYRNFEDADSGWRKLVAGYGDALAAADPQFTEIDTDSGRYVRLMAAFPPGSNADRTCRFIQERGFYCRVLAR
jgi:hypothetical protein